MTEVAALIIRRITIREDANYELLTATFDTESRHARLWRKCHSESEMPIRHKFSQSYTSTKFGRRENLLS